MSEPSEIKLVLKWRKTWNDREDDFVASAPNFPGNVGRFHKHIASSEGGWSWSFQAMDLPVSRGSLGETSGIEPSAREAAEKIEDIWFRVVKGTEYEETEPSDEPKPNAYAAAKGL
ncbi:hypothetical protein ACFSE0_21365 [Ochrobactrum teleogrylli]|uniref:Uncharacterized protein n=1 Tax=Ochrobactrum teleogrylli TaxID=2479765 RepID=A0ABY2Y3E1_9HYPH|nr:hypothetical protein [[Ochrobactrum] teleogrylli]TNV15138.1 hypothetical protein FIC94_13425 [[Ochrobactrum] teleogrylli]